MPQRDYSDFLGQQKKRRDLFEAMWAQSQGKPVRNVWEGLGNLGATLTYAYMADKKGDQVKEEEDAARKRYAGLVGALLGSNGQPSPVTAVQPPSPPPDPTVTQRPLSGGMANTEAIQQLETGGLANPDKAISPKGAAGRMQVMPDTAREVASSIPGPMGTLGRMASDSQVQAALSVPQVGQKAGDTYYAQMLAKYNDPVLAAAAYNAGPGRVDEALAASGGDINAFIAALPQETQAYLLGNAQRPGFIQMTGSPNGAGTNITMPSPGGASTPPAGAAPGAVVSSPPAPATAATMGMPEQVIALLNDPATFELGQELANMLIAQKMQGGGQQLETLTLSDGSIVQRDPSTGKLDVVLKGGILSPEQMQQEIQLRQAGRAQNTVNVGQSEWGPIPPGWQIVRGPNGEIRMTAIPGGPAEAEIKAQETKAELGRQQGQQSANLVVQDIDRALEAANNPGLFSNTGFMGALGSMIPGTPQSDLASLLDTIGSNIAFDKLQAMRAASPTGGALGAVTERELALLESTLGSLRQSQSKEQFVENLTRLRSMFNEVVNGPAKATPPGQVPTGGGIIEYDAQGNRRTR